jgi:hypothetical protein
MGLFIDSPDAARSPGAYAVEVTSPRSIAGVSSGYIGLVGQFAWGPVQSVATPDSGKALIDMFEPAGSPRNSTGYYAIMGRKGLTVKVVRVLAADAVAATASLAGTGGAVAIAAKYKGTLGNSISVQQRAAVSGNTSCRDYVVTLTNATTGTTQETYLDVPLPTGGNAVTVDVSKSLLLASMVAAGTMSAFPANATTSLSGGSNGAALASSDYTGTAGTTDKGVALFEAHQDVRAICHDDCGNTMRAAVNLAFAIQSTTLRDRRAYLDGNPDAADFASALALIVGGNISDRVTWCGAWVQANDDAGVARTVPFSTFVATAAINLEAQQSYAWRDPVALQYYDGIVGVVANFAVQASSVTDRATSTSPVSMLLPYKTAKGKYSALHDRATDKSFAVTRRIKDYLALSILPALDPFVNGPNVASDNAKIKAAVDIFLEEQVRGGRLISASTDTSQNSAATMGAGDFYLSIDGKSPAARERIFLMVNVGPTVSVRTN